MNNYADISYSSIGDLSFLSNSNESLSVIIGIVAIGLGFFGTYLTMKLKRKPIYKTKLGIVYGIPMVLGVIQLISPEAFDPISRTMFFAMYCIMMNILFWREVRDYTTTTGANKRQLVKILDDIPDMLWMKDLSGKFTYANKVVCDKFLLKEPEDVYGKTMETISAEHHKDGKEYEFRDVCENSDEIVRRTGERTMFLEQGYIDGKFIALQVCKAPLYDYIKDKKEMVGTVGLGRDLTFDVLDHDDIDDAIAENDMDKVRELFSGHRNRYTILCSDATDKMKDVKWSGDERRKTDRRRGSK